MRRVFVLALLLTVLLPLLAVLLALAAASSRAQCGGAVGPGSAPGVPSNLLAIYEQAAGSYQLGPQGWAYLAAINEIETNFGHNLSVSTAGAIGWMQFTPATWAQYQVSADPPSQARRRPRRPAGRDLHRRPLPEGQRRPRRLADAAVRLRPRRLSTSPKQGNSPNTTHRPPAAPSCELRLSIASGRKKETRRSPRTRYQQQRRGRRIRSLPPARCVVFAIVLQSVASADSGDERAHRSHGCTISSKRRARLAAPRPRRASRGGGARRRAPAREQALAGHGRAAGGAARIVRLFAGLEARRRRHGATVCRV